MESLLPVDNEQMLKATEATPGEAGVFYARVSTILERESVRVYKMPYVDERMTSALRSRQEAPCDVAAGRSF